MPADYFRERAFKCLNVEPPAAGVPLPLVSFGGSSMITFLGSFGILQSILIRSQKRRFSLSR